MLIIRLVLFAALAAAPTAEPDPIVLVGKLGSADPTERAAATESLKSVGRTALPALEKAMTAGETLLRARQGALGYHPARPDDATVAGPAR